jgi:O-antigen ligase
VNDPEISTPYERDEEIDLPVHNGYLWTVAELGVFGLISYFSIIILIMRQCWKFQKCPPQYRLIRGLSLAIFTAFTAYLFDIITDPFFREPVPYQQLWTYVAMITAFHIWRGRQGPGRWAPGEGLLRMAG